MIFQIDINLDLIRILLALYLLTMSISNVINSALLSELSILILAHANMHLHLCALCLCDDHEREHTVRVPERVHVNVSNVRQGRQVLLRVHFLGHVTFVGLLVPIN